MSEYQFYEFKSIDKSLTKEEQNIISSWSSRARLSSTGAIFTYSYSNFRQDELEVVEHYFDSMFYIANWGSKRIIFKFPKELINIEEVKKYCNEPEISLKVKSDYVLLDMSFSEEEPDDDWIDGEGYLSSFISLRSDIINGDYRCLYLAWLYTSLNSDYEDEEEDEDKIEPPIPLGLNNLNNALESFVTLLNINSDLLLVAIKNSKDKVSKKTPDILELIKKLPEEEKNSFLFRLSNGESLLSEKLLKRLKDFIQDNKSENSEKLRTVSELRIEVKKNKEIREQEEKKVKEELRLKKLSDIEKNENRLWEQVDTLISEKKSKSYDSSILILKDLRELAKHKKQDKEFNNKIKFLLEKYSKLSSLKFRISDLLIK